MDKKIFMKYMEFIRPKDIIDLTDILIAICIIYLVIRIFFVGPLLTGRLLNSSLIAYLLSYLVVSRVLAIKGIGYQRMFHSLATSVSGLWLFEIFYHFAYPNPPFIEDLMYIDISMGNGTIPLIWSIIMVSMVFTGWRYIKLNKWFWIISFLTLVSFYLWVATGYPQFFDPQWWPSSQPTIEIIPSDYRHATTPEAIQMISNVGVIFNSITKILTCLIPSSLFIDGSDGSDGGEKK